MIRADKDVLIEKMRDTFAANPHVVVTSFRGLRVNQDNELRTKLREAGASYAVVKNRLAKRAAEGTAVEKVAEHLNGPCAIACHADDPIVLAKTLADFAKANPALTLVAGVIDAKDVVDGEGVKQLASMPGLPELRAKLLSAISGPATQLVRLLGTPGQQLAQVLNARCEKEGGA